MTSEEVEINWEMNDPKVENVIEFRSKPELEGSGAEPMSAKRRRPRTYAEAFAAIALDNRARGSQIRGYMRGGGT